MLVAKFVVATRMRHGVHGMSAETTTSPPCKVGNWPTLAPLIRPSLTLKYFPTPLFCLVTDDNVPSFSIRGANCEAFYSRLLMSWI